MNIKGSCHSILSNVLQSVLLLSASMSVLAQSDPVGMIPTAEDSNNVVRAPSYSP